jgi:hypothetical protein
VTKAIAGPKVSTHSGDVRRLEGYIGSFTTVTWRPHEASASDIPAVIRAGTVSKDSCSASSSLECRALVPAHSKKVSTSEEL